ncbi:MAG: hypothetical protein LUH63_22155 [Parabacteroides sp.]|nr:hypothetical protein [Parabacteroides sp.]
MIHKIRLVIFACLLVACTPTGREDIATTETLLRQAAFYKEQLQYLPALETYRQAIRQAEKEKDSTALSLAYLETGKIYRNQSLKPKALQSEKTALAYAEGTACDSLRIALYREIADIYALSGQTDSAFHYYQKAGCRIRQAQILRQTGKQKEAETILKTELEQTRSQEEKAELYLALADLQISRGQLKEAEKNLSRLPPSHPHLHAALSRVAQSRGDSLQADFYHKSYLHYQDALRKEMEQNQVTQLLRTSEQKEWEARLSDSQKIQQGQMYVWIALLVSCGTGAWGYSRYRLKKTVDSLSETDFLSSEIYLRFHRKEEWKPTPKDWEELLQAFNRAYPEFRERLKRKIPKLSEQEWRMCCLIKMEVPPSTAAMLLCCTNQAISMRRVRLYQKTTDEKGTPEQCDAFIRDF